MIKFKVEMSKCANQICEWADVQISNVQRVLVEKMMPVRKKVDNSATGRV
jgi:hypothetical protein